MASRRLRKQLKKLLLAAPLILQSGCSPCSNPAGCGPCPEEPFNFDVNTPAVFTDGGSFDCHAACQAVSGRGPTDSCSQVTGTDGGVGVQCTYTTLCHTGRRPEGLLASVAASGSSPVGSWLAECARLEAAAVHAFARTAVELRAHGAPDRLVARARGAAADEVRHARAMRHHARRHGTQPLSASVAAPAQHRRPLLQLALENAVEGCVRETYGALVAQWQAKSAKDRALKGALKAIAHDETNHAELSWDLKAWFDTQLSAAEREQLRAAMVSAVAQLQCEAATPAAAECEQAAGVPSAEVAQAFIRSLREEVWRC
ncbi:MAG: hypothetical protein QM723_29265 [Myxococcaceae bacterium]